LKRCPFCGGAAVWQRDGGSYGYTPPTVWIACENEPWENPHGKTFDDRQRRCFARTKSIPTDRWEPGKGTYDVTPAARAKALAQWNERT
jgi:hypothetical protein